MISEKEYALRRAALIKKLKPNSFGVVLSAKPQTRSNDTEFPYRQNSNFYYLTGFKEDNAALVIVKSKKKSKTYLFVQKKDKTMELWTGKRVGEKKAKKLFDVDGVFTREEFDLKAEALIKESHNVYFDFTMEDERVRSIAKSAKHLHAHYNIASCIEELRLLKSDAEVALIKKALSITKEAHHFAIKNAKNRVYEFELQADIEYIFKKNGAYNDAYTSIVACGNSANTLHYISNDKKLVNGELILIDAGCEYEYYASDITRSIPVCGYFSEAQKELYEMILQVEKEIIAMVKPNIMRSSLQKKSEELLTRGLINLGILKGSLKKLLQEKKHKKYYPHGIGHWMGIDVHDQAPYKNSKAQEIPLAAGMVMTIEPGIYIDKNDKDVPKRFRGIGIRIEDDILVTNEGYENLSKDIVKEISEIESL